MDIIEILVSKIPHGKENAINRFRLSTEMGMSDRKVRELIQSARSRGHIILNLSDGNGYFQATEEDLDEISAMYWQEESRMLSIKNANAQLKTILVAAGRAV